MNAPATQRPPHFDTAQAARILGVTPRRLRQCVGAGLLEPPRDPRGRMRFGFVDLVVLRTMRGLMAKGVPVPQIARVLGSLRRQIGDRALTELTIYADGRRVVAWDGRSRWQPDSGQFLFNFDVARVVRGANRVAALAPRRRDKSDAPPEPPNASAEEWCDLAMELEHESPIEAQAAYRHALERDPTSIMAHINLGCLLHAAGHHGPAERHYRKALKHAPEHALAWYNLGVLLEDRQRPDEALPAYERAIAADAGLADAHYNAALLYERAGRKQDAVRHFAIYRRLERTR
ncbi:MAG: tetratricopeptide repeat protein [Deltaproteobacteria bacterium]|nr:tetratricopeptide repeat protein [Deltaproteobacteria bacterium]